MEYVEDIPGFIAAGKRERLVDGKIDRMEDIANPLIAHRRHESPGRVARPFHLGCFLSLAHNGPDITRLIQVYLDFIALALHEQTVSGKCFSDACLGVMKKVKITTESGRQGFDQDSGSTSKV
jgi:hypothetical protein